MSLAVLGPIVFEVSEMRARTWSDASRSGSARWATHNVYSGKPLKEFIGPGLDLINMTVRLDIERGVIPRDELRQMREQRDQGNVLQFTVGGELVGEYTLEDLNEEWRRVDAKGVLTVSVVQLKLEEYQ